LIPRRFNFSLDIFFDSVYKAYMIHGKRNTPDNSLGNWWWLNSNLEVSLPR
jgi:hypothetical protein